MSTIATKPGLWRERAGLDRLVMLDTPAVTAGMVVVAVVTQDWQNEPSLRFQVWPSDLVEDDAMIGTAYPSLPEIEAAGVLLLARWYRFLPSPMTNAETAAISRLMARFRDLGGMTPELSKAIGHRRNEVHA